MDFSQVQTTNDICIDYINSGNMQKYYEVRNEQHRILADESIKDAVVPEMGEQYPLLNMHLGTDAKVASNECRSVYYDKNSIVAYMVD